MKTTVSFCDFVDAFHRADRYDNFGYNGLRVIFDYLEELEQDIGEEIELDVVAICCDYNMASADDIARDYRVDVEGLDEDEVHEAVLEYLNDNTTVLGEAEGQIIFGVF